MSASDSAIMSFLFLGDGWHNYHHVFPIDYKNGELDSYALNITTAVIDFFALFGWAYDRKTMSEDVIRRRAKRTGDGSHPRSIKT